MMAFDRIFGLNASKDKELGRIVLDVVFGHQCIMLNDVGTILKLGINLPVPLLGFQYIMPDRLPLINIDYSEFPYLNRQVVTNAMLKKNTQFSLTAIKPLTALNNFAVNYATNELVLKALEIYSASGGSFTIITPYASLNNCYLKEFGGYKTHDKDLGNGFYFAFERLQLQEKQGSTLNPYLNSITNGVPL